MSAYDADLRPDSNRKQLFRSVAIYYCIARGWAWLTWSPVVLGTEGLKLIPITASLPVFSCIATLGPFLAGFIAYRIEYGKWRAVRLLPMSRLLSVWILLRPLLILLSMFVIFPALISRGGPGNWHWKASALLGIWVPMFNYNLLGGPLLKSSAGAAFFKHGSNERSLLGVLLSVWDSCGQPGISRRFLYRGAAHLRSVTRS